MRPTNRPFLLLLPFQVGRVVVERAPRSFKVINLHERKQILISPEDGILGDPDFFQFGQQSRPNIPVRGVLFRLLIGLDSQSKRNSRQLDLPAFRKRPTMV